ncbi:MAG: NAD-binding protein [Sulfuricurvum sp.]|uniref:NAD-binding protein n=1 Tax=Sulfuricurvum sp. TaxID=2025608 RepID=UPI002605C58C|nr:NAD-binding protein [Sulfuricurvum sp.]MDD2829657.1 NAD-binding protein [Sulfuricurvum sp.]MDD4948675.1 NAD-binding protein [Sulfuricurvum sp.]
MNQSCAAIFGYNEYSKQIIQKIKGLYHNVGVFVLNDEELIAAQNHGVFAEKFDLSDNWQAIEDRFNVDALVVFCALRDDAENVFLTISLRATYEHLSIIALAKDNESMMKMKSAGANKVMPILQIAASVISDILAKPIVTEVLHDVLYEDSDLSIMEIEVTNTSPLCGTYLHDTHFKQDFDVILLAVVDHEMGTTFSFASHGHNHHIDGGDVLVAIGYKEKLTRLKRWVRGEAS